MATNGHMEWFEQMDLKEQQNIIDSVNHIGRIVKRYASCNIGLRAFGAKAVGMPNYLQLGNCLQFSTFFGHIWDNGGNYWGNLWHFCGTLRKIRSNIWTILRQIVSLLGKLWHFWGNLGSFRAIWGTVGAICGRFGRLQYSNIYGHICFSI